MTYIDDGLIFHKTLGLKGRLDSKMAAILKILKY